ncbi:MAG: oligosaccharide flippase family protein [Eubacterium sp.]|nr:oligosaccharide flippase family protein [Eubacterium sp.]
MKKLQEFEKNSMILFVLLMVANICNYLFQIAVGNLMEVEDYGIVNTILGLIAILSIPTTMIALIHARYTAIFAAQKNEGGIAAAFHLMFRFVMGVSTVLLLTGIMGIQKVTDLFAMESAGYMIGVLVVTIMNLFFSITSGTLQGLKKFFPYGIQTVLSAVGKLILSVFFICLGWHVYGVLAAICVGTAVAILYGAIQMKEDLRNVLRYQGRNLVDTRELWKYVISAMLAQGCVIAVTNGDVLLVKLYFTDEVTGVYASASVIGKISMYVSTAIVAALFPMTVDENQRGKNTFPLLRKALLYGGTASFGSALGMSLFGKYVIGILFGERYQKAIIYLPYVCMFIVPLTLVTILMSYALAIGTSKMFEISMAVGTGGIFGLSVLLHETVEQIMVLAGMILIGVFAVNMIWLIRIKNRQRYGKS